MRKGPGSVYDKWHISMVICDTNMTGTTSGAGTAYPSGAFEFTRIPLIWLVTRLGLEMQTENFFGSLMSTRLV
jgi:hypothetical protein